jgi:hypothetical protein
MSNSILPVIEELEKIYKYFTPKFNNDLLSTPPPRIIIQSSGRKVIYGWYSANRWRHTKNKDKLIHEITITAESLSYGAEEAAHTLLHEMCHLVNHLNGIDDCNKSGYHNSKFKSKAEYVGLQVEKVRSKGYAITHPTDKLKEEIEGIDINKETFELFRLKDIKGESKQSKERTYKCNCTKIKSTKEVYATCNLCNEEFTEIFKLKLT